MCERKLIKNFVTIQKSVFISGLLRKVVEKMSDFVIAETEYGKVLGIKKVSALNSAYCAFLGIRYATPPVGSLRFKVSLHFFYSFSSDEIAEIEKSPVWLFVHHKLLFLFSLIL